MSFSNSPVSLSNVKFDGFEKRSKIRKAQVDIDNAKLKYEDALKGMQTQYANAVNDLANNQRNYSKQRDNYLLAEDVYKVTSDRYREGIASMTEVLQYTSLNAARLKYLKHKVWRTACLLQIYK